MACGVPSNRTALTKLGVGLNKVHFLAENERMNVDAEFAEWGINDDLVFTCISRLEEIKMVDHAIKACSIAKRAGIHFKLLLIGDGRQREYLANLAARLDLVNEVVFTGNKSQEWIAGALCRADINIAPLCGRSLLEASLSGTPSVAYDVDWHNEIVLPGRTGVLVENLDYVALGQSITILSKNVAQRLSFGIEIQKIAREVANPVKIGNIQSYIYRNLVSKK